MAITVVQQTDFASTGNVDSASVSFPVLPSAGSTIIVYGSAFNPGNVLGAHLTDNQGNTYTVDKSQVTPGGFAGSPAFVAHVSNIAAPSGTFTITWNAPGNAYYSFRAFEVTGLINVSPVDQTNDATGTGTPKPTAGDLDITTTQPEELLVAVVGHDNDGTETVSAGWTEGWEQTDWDTHMASEGDYRIVSSVGTYSVAWTGGANAPWAAVIVSFIGATVGVTDPLSGSSTGVGGGSAAISRAARLAGVSAGASTIFGSLGGTIGFAGVSPGAGGGTGSLSAPASLAGVSAGVSLVTAALGLLVPLGGDSDGVGGGSDGGDPTEGPPGLDVLPRPSDMPVGSSYSGAVTLWVDGIEVPRNDRKGLSWSSVVPGGDDRLSVDVDCKSVFFDDLGGLPEQRTHVEVKSELGDILWVGWIRKPVVRVAKGIFQGIQIEAEGYQYSGLVDPYEVHQVYGPPTVGDTSIDKYITTEITDAMDHARVNKTPSITAIKFPLQTINFEEDTESFFRKTAVDVWNTCNSLMAYVGNQLWWQVYSIDNQVTLEFAPHSGGPDYWEQGRAKQMDLEFDANDIVWRCAVDFGGEQTFVEVAAVPALNTQYEQGKALSLEAEARRWEQVRQVAISVVSKLNRIRITGGSLTIDQPINAAGCANLPPSWIRAGRVIGVTIPATGAPYHTVDTGGVIDGMMYIKRCEFSEESCEARLSASPWTDEAKALRMLPFQSTPGLTWGMAFGNFNSPPIVDKLPFIGSTPDPFRVPDLTPIVGSMIPSSYKTDGTHDFGPTGGVLDPKQTPKEVVAANYAITGLITSAGPPPLYAVIPGEQSVIAQAIPEMVVERIELLSTDNISGSITLRFDKFSRTGEITTTNYLAPVSLSNETFSETIIGSGDPDPGDPDTRKTFRTGDFIIIHVVNSPAPVNIKKLAIAIIGRKIWESFMPPTQGPGWVKRPSSPTYPHLSGWS